MEIENVLVTSVGSIIAQGIIKSLRLANNNKKAADDGKVNYKIIGADMSPLAAGLYRCDAAALVPPAIDTDHYVEEIIKLCREQDIRAIFVGSDDELLSIAGAKDRIQKESASKVLVGPLDLISTARDKWKTFQFCTENNLPHAPSSLPSSMEEFLKEFDFPLVVKPREGYGSVHFYVVKSREEIKASISYIESAGWHPIIQQLLLGEEFTTGVTIDSLGKDVMSSIAIKKIIRHGQTYKAFIDDFAQVRSSAEECALKMRAQGAINIQSKLIDDSPIIFEVNPRFSASCALRAVAGVNEPDIVFRNSLYGEKPRISSYAKFVCMRYWNEVFVPPSVHKRMILNRRIQHQNDDSFIPDYF